MDVSVVDAAGRPVRGLTAADFTVTEDGQAQRIVAFAAIEVRQRDAASEPPGLVVPSDVVANAPAREGRLVVLVLDDALLVPAQLWGVQRVREVGRRVIDGLAPGDLAAVVYTRDPQRAQEFTGDRGRLLAAVDRFVAQGDTATGWLLELYAVTTLRRVVETLAEVPDRRKLVIYVSPGLGIDLAALASPVVFNRPLPEGDPQGRASALVGELRQIFHLTQAAHVPIYAFDVNGLCVGPGGSDACRDQREFLQTVAEETGGFAVVRTNDFAPGVAQVFEQNAAYYVLGYEPTNQRADGRFRRIEVRVGRPGVRVRARGGYVAPGRAPAARREGDQASLTAVLAGPVPKADLALAAWAGAFAEPPGRARPVVLVVGVPEGSPGGAGAATGEEVAVLVAAYDVMKKPAGSRHLTVRARGRAEGGEDAGGSEAVARLDLAPGRYHLRIAAERGDAHQTGSVFLDLEVPDFVRAPALSAVAVGVTPGTAATIQDELRGVIPFVPTTRRSFARDEQVGVFFQVCRGRARAGTPVTLAVEIRTEAGAAAVAWRETLAAKAFGPRGVLARRLELPLARLAAGPYRFVVTLTMGRESTVRRELTFLVR